MRGALGQQKEEIVMRVVEKGSRKGSPKTGTALNGARPQRDLVAAELEQRKKYVQPSFLDPDGLLHRVMDKKYRTYHLNGLLSYFVENRGRRST